MYISPRPTDDPAIAAYVARDQELHERTEQIRLERRTIAARVDELRLEQRPTYPTADQRAGITAAAAMIRTRKPAKSHHGDPCGPEHAPYLVVATPRSARLDTAPDADRGWLHIRHLAPSRAAGIGERLWDYTDAEVEQLLDAVRDTGLTVDDHWRSIGGLSVTVTIPSDGDGDGDDA